MLKKSASGYSSAISSLRWISETLRLRIPVTPSSSMEQSASRIITVSNPQSEARQSIFCVTARLISFSTVPSCPCAPPSNPPWPASRTTTGEKGAAAPAETLLIRRNDARIIPVSSKVKQNSSSIRFNRSTPRSMNMRQGAVPCEDFCYIIALNEQMFNTNCGMAKLIKFFQIDAFFCALCYIIITIIIS